MPSAARLGPRRFGVLGESGAELVAPAADRLVRGHDTSLEQKLFDVAQAQAEPKIPTNRAADDDGREAVTMIKRFRFLYRALLEITFSKKRLIHGCYIDKIIFAPSIILIFVQMI